MSLWYGFLINLFNTALRKFYSTGPAFAKASARQARIFSHRRIEATPTKYYREERKDREENKDRASYGVDNY